MTAGIIVTYNPDLIQLEKCVRSIIDQLEVVVLVDNSTTDFLKLLPIEITQQIHIVAMGENVGIARAQNLGVKYVLDNFQEVQFLFFSDQDSVVGDNVVNSLINSYVFLQTNKYKPGIVGTNPINESTNVEYRAKAKVLGSIVCSDCIGKSELLQVISVISSASLISAENYRVVGGFDESLFIDGVDHEWCWRAKFKMNLNSFIVKDARILHNLGDGDKNLIGRSISIASPTRIYYQYRNYIWLIRRKYVPLHWKIKHFVKYLVKIPYYCLIPRQRLLYLKGILRGLKDGLFKSAALNN